jgi:hypothetical protein
MGRIVIPQAPRQPKYLIEYMQRLLHTGKNYHGSQEVLKELIQLGELPANTRFANLTELIHIYKASGEAPAGVAEFQDYFGGHESGECQFEHTLTGLRWEDNWVGRLDGNAYRLIVLDDDKEVGEAKIPGSCGNEVLGFNEFCIPTHIAGTHHNEPHAVHFYLETDAHFIQRDERTGKYDIGIIVGPCEMAKHHDCISIYADYGRSAEFPGATAIRAVRTVLSKKEKEKLRGLVMLADKDDSQGAVSLPEEDKAGRLSPV